MIEQWIFKDEFKDTPISELISKQGLHIDCLLGEYGNYTPEQLKSHYAIEVDLADRLKHAEAREGMYTSLYDELFKRVPYHVQLQKKLDKKHRPQVVSAQLNKLLTYLTPESTYLEVGPGDCLLPIEVAKNVKQVYAVDVSNEVTKHIQFPPNFELVISDGTSIPVPNNSVDLVFSNQLMEHLHPDDAMNQLENIVKALKPGGKYLCVTPHRFGGPADVSRFFDETAKGFHLKEYVYGELWPLFKSAGFSKIYTPRKGINMPIWPIALLESALDHLTYKTKKKLYHKLKPLMRLVIIGVK